MTEFKFTVTKEDEGLGVKKLLRKHFNFSSRLFTKLKKEQSITLNGRVIQGWMIPVEGDEILAILPDEESHFPEADIPIEAAYEDEDLLIVNKQPYVTVHPTKGHPEGTIANGLMKYMRETGQKFKIRFVNRLDMDTSGLLIVGKNSHAQDDISNQMMANTTCKYYLALVWGIIEEDEFTIDLPIGKPEVDNPARCVMEGGQDSITHVKVVERFNKGFTLVELKLETGRTHQIRVHMSHIGHPIVGDTLYAKEYEALLPRQALHAYKLEFDHPVTSNRIIVNSNLPEDIKELIESIRD